MSAILGRNNQYEQLAEEEQHDEEPAPTPNPFLEGVAADKVDGYIPVDIAFSGVDPKLL